MSTTSTYTVNGMTCGHCVASVTDEVSKIDGVTAVDVDLASGQVTVESDGPLDDTAVAAAVDEAGYDHLRIQDVADRVDAYNRELEAACEKYGTRCRWDGGDAHRVRFSLDLVNEIDYFHPDVEGQHKLADVTYPGRFTW